MALIICQECGKEISDQAENCLNCGYPISKPQQNIVQTETTSQNGFWSAGRLSIGIISMILFVFVSFQSCAAGLSNTLEDNGSTSGSNGFAYAVFVLIAGIVGVCTRNSKGKAGAIITTVLYWLASLFTVGTGGTYADLPIWGMLSFVFGIVFLICAIKTKKVVSR